MTTHAPPRQKEALCQFAWTRASWLLYLRTDEESHEHGEFEIGGRAVLTLGDSRKRCPSCCSSCRPTRLSCHPRPSPLTSGQDSPIMARHGWCKARFSFDVGRCLGMKETPRRQGRYRLLDYSVAATCSWHGSDSRLDSARTHTPVSP